MTEIPAIPWVARENQRFLAILRAFDEAAWRRPSCCTGWSAAHVVGHMTLGARFYAAVVEAGRAGRLEPPFGAKDAAEFRKRRIGQMEELVALPGGERIARFEEAVGDLQAVFEAVPAEDLDKPAWHPRCPTPIRHFPGQRLYELILHEWDIRNTPEEDLHPAALGMAVEVLQERLPFFYNQSPVPGLEAAFRFETAAPSSAWGMKIRAGRAALRSGEGNAFDVRTSAPASDLILLTTGRADAAAKEAAGRLRIEGDRKKAEALAAVLFQPF